MRCVWVPLAQQARQMRWNSRDNNCNPQRESGVLGLCKLPSAGSSTRGSGGEVVRGGGRSSCYNWLAHCPCPAIGVPNCHLHEARKPYAPSIIAARHGEGRCPINENEMKTPQGRKEDAKTHILTKKILLTKKKREMCERHSQAPPTLASPRVETTERKRGAPA
jgi:hypothetical protein